MIFNYLIGGIIFILGVCIGSFLNCYIYRLEEEKSLKGRSFCPNCKHTLSWLDLFPVFSWVFLRGRCRYCKAKISMQYPLVELATGILFVLISNLVISNWILNSNFKFQISNFAEILFLFYVASALVVIFVYDFKHYLIPDKVLFPAIFVTAIYQLILNFPATAGSRQAGQISNYLLAGLLASGFFLALFLITKGKGMGFGDVKLAILMGLLLGIPNVFVALFLAFLFGAIIGLILMVRGKKGLKSEIPFGPFLIAGTFIALFWGSRLVTMYMNLFLI